VPGRVAIPYGEYKDPEYGITVFKNGLEIAPEQGEKPKAVAGGRVVYADWFKGYGLLLIVDHDNGYHSLYGNLSEIFLKSGDILIEGTVVGNIGNSQILNYPTLYFEIRHKGKPVNPSQWLTRKGYPKKKVRIK
jgi:septal ring factor EnvC (AmiA/AmiB activator)